MTTPLHNTVALTHPNDVLAAVPLLVGFRPAESVILIAVHDTDRAPRLGLTLRADLPPADQRYQLADYLLNGPIGRRKVDGVLVVVVGGLGRGREAPESGDPAPPQRKLVGVFREVFGAAGISVLHATWTPEIRAGVAWQCYDEDGCQGVISDSTSSPLAAALTAAGVVTFESRRDWEQLVAPEASEVLARRAARLDAMYEDLEERRGSLDGVQRDLEIVLAAIRRVDAGAPLTEDDLLRVLIAVSDNRVRDVALGMALGEWASAAERLWTDLVRKAPEPELAEVAALLACSAYLRGDGALAGVALERIEATRPDHRLGVLLRRALDVGIAPRELAVIVRDAADDARTLIDEDGAW
jgi:hypothetical protein